MKARLCRMFLWLAFVADMNTFFEELDLLNKEMRRIVNGRREIVGEL